MPCLMRVRDTPHPGVTGNRAGHARPLRSWAGGRPVHAPRLADAQAVALSVWGLWSNFVYCHTWRTTISPGSSPFASLRILIDGSRARPGVSAEPKVTWRVRLSPLPSVKVLRPKIRAGKPAGNHSS